MKKFLFLTGWISAVLVLITNGLTLAQTTPTPNGNAVLKITYPESRAVFQRRNDNTTIIYLSGSYYQPIDSVQARLQNEASGQGIETNWVTIQRNPQGGVFQGQIRGTGGWYRLEVRAFSAGRVLGEDRVRKIGIGEVFIITGQSNAQGFQDFGAAGAADDRVNCITYNNTETNSLGDPPAPTFQQLSASALIGPRGQSAWCWGMLGDLIAQQYNVPVLFINTAWAGTTSKNWAESAAGRTTVRWFDGKPYPEGMPYANLRIALTYYGSLQGLRAVLWQQGENDNYPINISKQEYQQNLQFLINKIRQDVDRYPAWVLARSSYNEGRTSRNVIDAQTDIVNTYNNNVYGGPFLDNLQVPRPDGVHFSGEGLRQLAQAWYESLNAVFFASSILLPPLPPPTLTVACAPGNNGLTVSLPAGYRSYDWKNGQTGRTITITQPGTYRATVKDSFGNTLVSPAIEVTTPVQPATPSIVLARQPGQPAAQQQQVCADSLLTLTTNAPVTSGLSWNVGSAGRSISVGTAGTYNVQAVSVYGCRSGISSSVNLVVQPKLAPPTIEKVGTYSLQAILPPNAQPTEQFDWRRGNNGLKQTSSVIKATINGAYSVRARSVFTLANGNQLTCVSNYSAPLAFESDLSNDGLSVYPNPSTDGLVAIETAEDIPNAEVSVYTLSGQLVFEQTVPSFNERKFINLSNIPHGSYIIRIKADGYKATRRIVVNQ